MRFLRIAICITAIVLPLGVHAQVGPCSGTNTCAPGQVCVGPEGSRLCYRTCNPAAASGAIDACPAGESCGRPTGIGQDVCELSAPPSSSSESTEEAVTEVPFVPITPQLGVPIPGGSLTPASQEGGLVRVAFLAEYINAAYRYLATIALVIAIVMCVYGGFLYLGGSAGIGEIKRGKKIITDAIVGMLLILASFGILNIINPDTTNLKVLELAFVKRVELDFRLQESLGSLGDEEAYRSASDLPAGGEAGTWRARMLAVCGSRNGMSLSYPQKVEKLKEIVRVWKTVGADEGGAIYIRGGDASCRGNHGQANYLRGLLEGFEGNVRLTSPCNQLVASNDTQCLSAWRAEYDRLVTSRANTAGLLCGDCATTVRDLYMCFAGSEGRTRVMGNRPTNVGGNCRPQGPSDESLYVFRLERDDLGGTITEGHIDGVISRLRFGDVISYIGENAGHVFMYTGGAGLGYEMMEMGSGGRGDISSGGGRRASENAGLEVTLSGMQAYSSARSYLSNLVSSSRNRANPKICIWAWRPMGNP
ncbi:hypothetical protein IPH19_00695 [Candidatus Uhrbacteria bacterium]|nr:MAG: hypothetical protein IPH19_00695 [Candidatus Uhrbacteria bacterium]